MAATRSVELGSFTPVGAARRGPAHRPPGPRRGWRWTRSRCRPRPRQFRSLIDGELARRAHQPGQRPGLPVQPDQPAGPAARRPDGRRRSTAAWAWASGRAPGSDGRRPPGREGGRRRARPRASRWRCTRCWSVTASAVTSTSWCSWARHRGACARSWRASCAATMLDAGNELVAEAAGCALLAVGGRGAARRTSRTVLAVAREEQSTSARRWPRCCSTRSPAWSAAELDDVAVGEAAERLEPRARAGAPVRRGAGRCREGLVAGGVVDAAALRTLVDLRQHWLPRVVDGRDVLDECVARPRPRGLSVTGGGRLAAPAPGHHAGQHARPVRDAADAGGDRGEPAGPLGQVVAAAGAYFLVYGLGQPLWGFASDRFGRVRTLRLSLAVAGLLSLVSALSRRCWSSASPAGSRVGSSARRTLGPHLPRRHRRPVAPAAGDHGADGRGRGRDRGSLGRRRTARRRRLVAAGVRPDRGRPRSCWPWRSPGCRSPSGPATARPPAASLGGIARSRVTLLVLLFAFAEGVVLLGALTLLPTAVESAGASATLAGAVTGVYGLSVLVGSSSVGRLSLAWHPRAADPARRDVLPPSAPDCWPCRNGRRWRWSSPSSSASAGRPCTPRCRPGPPRSSRTPGRWWSPCSPARCSSAAPWARSLVADLADAGRFSLIYAGYAAVAVPLGLGAVVGPETLAPTRRAEGTLGCPRVQTPTLRDVADAAGVHPATASRALNPATRGLVNEETARRVIRVAEELGYRPNPIARSLKTAKSEHDRAGHPGPHQPAVPADRPRHRGRARAGRLQRADRQHRQRPGARARPDRARCGPGRSRG